MHASDNACLQPAIKYEAHCGICFLFPTLQLSTADGVIAIDLEWKVPLLCMLAAARQNCCWCCRS